MVAREDRMGLQMDHDVEIARRAAVHAGFPFPGEPDAVPFVHAGGDFHG